ncbi:EF-hand domain-containing protein [Streptomyces globisporus]|uniref:EF-hand domain-containing protein n=1 Tax=Streptomyces globisporus TaxID=1908 RepID=UPI0004C8B95C|nr:EF-hand domain-containing protein [Streptomyces globisporus]
MTDLRDLKYSQWFKGADVDGDGFITRQDVLQMGKRFSDARGDAAQSATGRRLTEELETFWNQVIAPMDQDGDGQVDLQEMTAGFRRALTDPNLYQQQIQLVADCFFDLIDLDGNGKIDQSEFGQIFGLAGNIPIEDCAPVFAALDRDGSGALDRSEFHQALTEFFYGNDPDASANHLFGKIAIAV